jgi:hypothetical protein
MAQQKPDPKLIDSMAMRYRHDFGLLEEPHKEAIRTTMKQLWEEVVGLGFYKDEQFGNSEQLAQQKLVNSKHLESSSAKNAQVETAVEWLLHNIPDLGSYIPLGISLELHAKVQQAKEMFQEQIEDTWKAGYREALAGMGSGKNSKYNNAEQYYTQTYGK